ncbi:MAG TPA: hypothetical protein VFA74_20000 [Terriglobales bacterium]|nr:hypothetical protein [Terriglobales bacterium]
MDLLPLCDQHYRTMEFSIAPYNFNYSIEFFRCTDKFCPRCFSEVLGYVTPKRDEPPLVLKDQPRCEKHGRPLFISSLDRQRNIIRYACPEHGCQETQSRDVITATR